MRAANQWTALLGEANAALARYPRLRWWWGIAAAVAVLRLLLLGAFMVDGRLDLGALPGDAFYKSHSCLTAYWRAAALAMEGATNLYDSALYEGRTIDGFGIDVYVYPPSFLLWPSAIATVSNDFKATRTGWFVVELGLFLWSFGSVARWIGGRWGARCLLWLPVVVTALPVLLGLQMGNFHLAAISLAMVGMLAVEEERPCWGGFCIAAGIGAKLFPAILLVILAGRRKTKPILWTLAWLAVETAAIVALFGANPLTSFLDTELPRLMAADRGPWEAPGLFGTVNSGIFGLALKARAIGIPMGPVASSIVSWIYAIALLTAAASAGLAMAGKRDVESARLAESRHVDGERVHSAESWLAFLGLASLGAPFIPDAYGAVPALWLLALIAAHAHRSRLVWIALAFLFLWPVLPSRIAVPGFEFFRLAFTLAAQLVLLAVMGAVAMCSSAGARPRPRSNARTPRTLGAFAVRAGEDRAETLADRRPGPR